MFSNVCAYAIGDIEVRKVSAQLFFVNIVFFDPGMHFLYVNQVFYATWFFIWGASPPRI